MIIRDGRNQVHVYPGVNHDYHRLVNIHTGMGSMPDGLTWKDIPALPRSATPAREYVPFTPISVVQACEECGEQYVAHSPLSVMCSARCRGRRRYRLHKARKEGTTC